MRKQDFLIELIKSLTPSESRYFKLYGSIQPGEKKYLELFDNLERGTTGTKQLCNTLKVTATNLGVLKHYLYQMIMRCLRNFDEQSSQAAIINTSKEDARVLLKRNMPAMALDVAEKTLAKAWEVELFEVIDDLLTIKTRCLHLLHRRDELNGILQQYQKVKEIQIEFAEINLLTSKVAKLETERKNTGDFKKLVKHPLLKKKPEQLKSLRSQIRWFDSMFSHYMAHNANEASLEIALRENRHYIKHARVKKVNPVAYVVNLTRVANGEYVTGNPAKALKYISKVTEILKDTSLEIPGRTRENIDTYNKLFKVTVLLQLHDFENAVKEAEYFIKTLNTKPAYNQYSAIFDYAVGLFHLQRNEKALDQINTLLQIKTDARIDLQHQVRLLSILVHYNLHNYQLIPYLVKSTKAWMKRNKQVSAEYDLFFKQILLASKSSLTDRQKGLKQLSNLVTKGKLKDIDKAIFLKTWLNSRAATA